MRTPERSVPRLKLLSLIAATYFIVSGGPYGLEELLAKSGYQQALLILLITPLVWSFPTAMMVGELASALPEEGGYYAWVRRGLGQFWGFQEAWLSLVASVFDMAIYPTVFILYLGRWIPELGSGLGSFAIGFLVVAACAWWNIRGAAAVGRASVFFAIVLLAPFAILGLLALRHPSDPPAVIRNTTLLGGILVAMWNYTGWDNASTFANEVEKPQRNYPLAILVTVALVTLSYVIPVLGVRRTGMDATDWTTGAWVSAGGALGGPTLAALIVLGGMVSAIGAFNSLVLSYSHLPVRMADDGLLPKVFQRRHPKTQAPWVSIIVCAIAYVGCLGLGFDRLVEIDMIVYGLSLGLEFVALVVLRKREPSLPRPFRIPGGNWGVILIGIPPMALLAVALVVSAMSGGKSAMSLGLSLVLVAAGALVYPLARRHATGSPETFH